jgi:hypothetical protein
VHGVSHIELTILGVAFEVIGDNDVDRAGFHVRIAAALNAILSPAYRYRNLTTLRLKEATGARIRKVVDDGEIPVLCATDFAGNLSRC